MQMGQDNKDVDKISYWNKGFVGIRNWNLAGLKVGIRDPDFGILYTTGVAAVCF